MIISQNIFKPWLLFNAITHSIITQIPLEKIDTLLSVLRELNKNNSQFEIETLISVPQLNKLLNQREDIEKRVFLLNKKFLSFDSFSNKEKKNTPIKPFSINIPKETSTKEKENILSSGKDAAYLEEELNKIDKKIELYCAWLYRKTYNFLELKNKAPYINKNLYIGKKAQSIRKEIIKYILPQLNYLSYLILKDKKLISKLINIAIIREVLSKNNILHLKAIEEASKMIHYVNLDKSSDNYLKIEDNKKMARVGLFHIKPNNISPEFDIRHIILSDDIITLPQLSTKSHSYEEIEKKSTQEKERNSNLISSYNIKKMPKKVSFNLSSSYFFKKPPVNTLYSSNSLISCLNPKKNKFLFSSKK